MKELYIFVISDVFDNKRPTLKPVVFFFFQRALQLLNNILMEEQEFEFYFLT